MSVNKYQPHVYVLPEDDANQVNWRMAFSWIRSLCLDWKSKYSKWRGVGLES